MLCQRKVCEGNNLLASYDSINWTCKLWTFTEIALLFLWHGRYIKKKKNLFLKYKLWEQTIWGSKIDQGVGNGCLEEWEKLAKFFFAMRKLR